jgi:hypothetical protein
MSGDGFENIQTKKEVTFNKKPILYLVCGLVGVCLVLSVLSPAP